jgi:hypothetical protein
MTDNITGRLTKSDFLLYCEAPRHLWAKKHHQIEQKLSDFERHLIDEGYAVEALALEYFETIYLPNHPQADLFWQRTHTAGPFEARSDALIYWPDEDRYDLFEIKSGTSTDKKDLYDVAFQVSILKEQFDLKHSYLLHLNKGYIRAEEVDLSQLFIAEDVTAKVDAMQPEIYRSRQTALLAAGAANPNLIPYCLNPKSCPCPSVCHPNLPDFSIFDIPRLSPKNKVELLKLGIRDAREIPSNFGLNPKQRLVVERAQTNREHLDREALRKVLEPLQFPLWFLDYETCLMAVPRYAGYHPQQQAVFQYSLHRLDAPAGRLQHTGYIATTPDEPTQPLLQQLAAQLGDTGAVVVWNKTFEMTMNREMAKLYPEYAAFLENLNARIFDLGEIINLGIYLHPAFKGSWSLKNVLPVMVPELSYQDLEINQGDQASVAWWNITHADLPEAEKQKLIEQLERYCAQDTLAMVELYQKFRTLL